MAEANSQDAADLAANRMSAKAFEIWVGEVFRRHDGGECRNDILPRKSPAT